MCGLCVNQILGENECHTQLVSLKKFNKIIIRKYVGMELRTAQHLGYSGTERTKKLIEGAAREKLCPGPGP